MGAHHQTAPAAGTATTRILLARARDRCAICRCELAARTVPGEAPAGAGERAGRGPETGEPQVPILRLAREGDDRYDNLIVLCPRDYEEARRDPHHYSADRLSRLKVEHEEWVRQALADEQPGEVGGRYDPRYRGVTLLPRIREGHALVDFLDGIHSIQFDHDPPESEAEALPVERFLHYVMGLVDVWDRYDVVEKRRVGGHLDRQIRMLDRAGWLLCGVRHAAVANLAGTVGDWHILRLWILREGVAERV